MTLVIDACVGGRARRQTGASLRFLGDVLELRHAAAMDNLLKAEWREHCTPAAYAWQRAMYARKLIVDLGDVRDNAFRAKVAACTLTEKQREAVDKDLHLIESARRVDRTVVSVDEIARQLMQRVGETVGEVRTVTWVSPLETTAAKLGR